MTAATVDFKRWLGGSEARLTLTYDRKTALDQRNLPFITPVHPLAKAAIKYLDGRIKAACG